MGSLVRGDFLTRIICDVYQKEHKQLWGDDLNDAFNQKIMAVNNMYGWLKDAGILENISFEFHEQPQSVCFAFDVKDLAPYRDSMEKCGIAGSSLAVRHIFDENYTPCHYSGAIQLGWSMFSYRDVDGYVGRSWECDLIKGLNNNAIYDVQDILTGQGVKAAVQKLFSYYIWPETEKSNIRDWYLKAYPSDDLGAAINSKLTFQDIIDALNHGNDVYSVIGVSDSVVRERIFGKISEILDIDYAVIYNKWLDGNQAPDISGKETQRKSSLDAKIQSKNVHKNSLNAKQEEKNTPAVPER